MIETPLYPFSDAFSGHIWHGAVKGGAHGAWSLPTLDDKAAAPAHRDEQNGETCRVYILIEGRQLRTG